MQARHRCLSHTISTDVEVAALEPLAQLLFTWMIAHADNLGRMRGEASLIRLTVVPHLQVSDKQVDTWLTKMHTIGLIDRYHSGGIWYIALTGWEKHQRLVGNMKKDSHFPAPPIRTNVVHTAYEPCIAPVSPEGEGEVEGEVEEKNTLLSPRGDVCEQDFAALWKTYPHYGRRSSKTKALARWKAMRPRPDLALVISGLRACGSSDDWTRDGGRFVPAMEVWIAKRGWDASDGRQNHGTETDPLANVRRLVAEKEAQHGSAQPTP